MPVTRICASVDLLDIFGSGLVDGAAGLGRDRAEFVDGLADDVEDAAEGFVTDRTEIGAPVSRTC